MTAAEPASPELDRSLQALVADLRAAAGDNLLGVALYGGLAKGRFTPGISDVNVLVVVRDAGLPALGVLAPVLTRARRADRVTTFVATPGDLRATARLFPVKLADIRAAHRLLYGDIGLSDVEPDRAALRLRARQEIKNIELRLRQRVVERGAEPEILWGGVVQSLPKLAVTLETVLRVAGETVPAGRDAVMRAAARALGMPPERVEPFARLHRHEPRPDDATVRSRSAEYLTLLAELEAAVDRRLSA